MAPPPSLQDLIDVVHRDAPSDGVLDQLVTAATTVAQLEEASDALLGHFVDRCRREGRSWSEISAALGVTKQAVHKRFAASLADQIIAAVPAPTMERFTGRARVVVTEAARVARAHGQQAVGSAHILLALFTEPEGIAGKVLGAMGVSREKAEAGLRAASADHPSGATDGTDVDDQTGHRFTSDGRKVLRSALAVALELGHNYIGTEHLLLALYREADAPAAVILAGAGTNEQQARAHVTQQLSTFRS
jgi:ATP-dependent Clp protease ATP-binding subunit ClpA